LVGFGKLSKMKILHFLLLLLVGHFCFAQDYILGKNFLYEYSFPLKPINDALQFEGSGTCFIMECNSKYYIISAWHVFTGRDPKNYKLLKGFTKDAKYSAIIQFKSSGQPQGFLLPLYSINGHKLLIDAQISDTSFLDIAALEIPKDSILQTAFFSMDKIDTSTHINIGDSVLYCGYPTKNQAKDTFNLTTYLGIVLGFDDYRLKTDQYAPYGCSGSPLLLKRGKDYKLYGVLFESEKYTETPSFFLSIKVIIDLINDHTK
jgi:hypothetical protein